MDVTDCIGVQWVCLVYECVMQCTFEWVCMYVCKYACICVCGRVCLFTFCTVCAVCTVCTVYMTVHMKRVIFALCKHLSTAWTIRQAFK